MTKILLNSRHFLIEDSFFHIIVFPKSVATPSHIRSVINFYTNALKRSPEKYFRGYCGFGFQWSNYTLCYKQRVFFNAFFVA